MGLWGSVESPNAKDALAIRLVPDSDPPERRLRHLVRVANALAGLCRDFGDAYLEPMAKAIRQEAASLAKNPVERILAQRVDESFTAPAQRKVLPAPLAAYASRNDIAGMTRLLARAGADPMLAGQDCWTEGSGTNCRVPASQGSEMPRDPFHIDERDERGLTALMSAARAMQYEAVKWLLEKGADIEVLSGP
jgi:hypothetical protein